MKDFYWSWRGAVAVTLALGLAVTVVLLSVGQYHATPEEANTISTVLGAVVGALATYVGGKHSNDNGTHHNGD